MFDGFSQFLVMMYKGFLLRKRHYIVTAFEIIIPLVIACPITIIIANMPPEEDASSIPDYQMYLDLENTTYYLPYSPFKSEVDRYNVFFLYTPNNTKSAKLMKEVVKIFQKNSPRANDVELLAYKDETDLEQSGMLLQAERQSRTVVGIVLSNFLNDYTKLKLPSSLEYKIRYGNPYGYDMFDLNSKYSYRFVPRYGSEYTDTKFLALQASVEQAFIAQKSGKSEMNGDYRVQMNCFPYPPRNRDSGSNQIIEAINILIIYSFVIYISVMVKRVVVEKANHSKELLKMMGMSDCTYWNSVFWNSFLFGAILMLVIAIMYTVPLENSRKVFENVNFGLLYFIFLLYLASTILFCLAVTTFFNRPNVAVTVTLLLHTVIHSLLMVFYFPIGIENYKFVDLSFLAKLGICLLPNGALPLIFKFLAAFEGPGGYDGWNSITKPSVYSDIVFGEVILIMMVSCFVYALLIWYVDSVWPWQLGVPKPFYFPFTRSYWCGDVGSKSEAKPFESENPYFERYPDGTPGIVIRNLTKVFKVGLVPKKVVDDLSMNIYTGEITALLGRNGAGKTTTINILTGLYLPTKGSASINGYDIHTDTKQARSSLGICPQHNVLYDTLTVEEHLKLYAGLKGVKWGDLAAETTRILKLFSLDDKRNALSQSLSGGQKRKLSLGIAVIGGSKVLFLDEPTSGMNPEARRGLWDFLLDIRGDHTIILTTHYMEEADILGDRIAIMADGKVQCCGSPMFLKKKFGTGYHIHMDQNSNCDITALTALLQRYCPETTLESAPDSLNLTYSLGSDAMGPILGAMFQDLESKKVELGVSSFGITVTTMDDVFLKVSMLAGEDLTKYSAEDSDSTTSLTLESSEDQFLLQYEKLISPEKLWMQRVASLFMKRAHYAKRQWGLLIFQVLVPFVLTCLFLYLLRSASSSSAPNPLKLDLSSVYGDTEGAYNFKNGAEEFGSKAYLPVIQASNVKATEADDVQAYGLNLGQTDLSKYLKKLSIGGVGNLIGKNLQITAWYNGEPFHILPMALNRMHVALLRFFTGDDSSSITLTNSPLPSSSAISMDPRTRTEIVTMLVNISMPLIVAFYSACYVLVPIQECASKAKLLQLMSGISAFTYWLSMFAWDMFLHTAISLLLIVPFGIFAGFMFFPHPEAIGSVIFLLLLFGWSTLPIRYLLSCGIKKPATGFSLALSFTIVAGLFLSVIMSMIETYKVCDENKFQTALYFLRFLPSFTVTWGMSNLIVISYANSYCESIPANILDIQCNLQSEGMESQFAQCCKDTCGNNCFNKTYPITWDASGCGREMFFLWFDGIIFFGLLFFCETGIMGKAWTILISKLPWKKTGVAAQTAGGMAAAEIDDDVFHEGDRIRNSVPSIDAREALVVKDLTKWYKGFCAVDGLTFGVRKEECFGLLGVNGAGKSSTFKMLTGDIFPTKGNAYIQDASIQTSLKKFQSFIGYCPQYDALIDRLTAREILQLFASLRGIAYKDIKSCVNNLIRGVDLEENADKPCKFYRLDFIVHVGIASNKQADIAAKTATAEPESMNIPFQDLNSYVSSYLCRKWQLEWDEQIFNSLLYDPLRGGNKRKLSLAVALIGTPPIILLDEPTAGVDPVSRRKIWSVLEYARKVTTSAVILCTHSMDECEALCNRLVIMVNGQFRCLGSIQHLKSQYGLGFTVIIKLTREQGIDDQTKSAIKAHFLQTFPSANLKDDHQGLFHYHIKDTGISWSFLFKAVENMKQTFQFEDYLISGTTLEQIFLAFARGQGVSAEVMVKEMSYCKKSSKGFGYC